MIVLCALADIPDGEARGFNPMGESQQTIVVARKGACVYAYENMCPHQPTRLGFKRDRFMNKTGGQLMCAAHGALFSVETGECTIGPCIGERLVPLPIQLDEEGQVYLMSEPQEADAWAS
ncbi:MAG: Rieske (2Fe-2S) protein [Pseudomonadota bacterium]